MARLTTACLAATIAFATASAATAAGTETFRGQYTVSYLGLTIARASFNSRYDGDSYTIDGSVSSAGLAALFDDTKGTLRATGRLVDGGRMQPQSFRADYTYGKKASMVDIRFFGGRVASTKVVPPPKKRGKNWVPVTAADLTGVIDPIASTAIRADSPDKVCGRTVRIYDGEMRANLNLSYVSTGQTSVPGFKGETVTCQLKLDPVAGYSKTRKGLKYVRDKSRILVAFAPLGKSGVYAPVYATVGTQIGTITLSAQRFEASE